MPGVPVAHPLGITDDRRVVGRDAELVGELVGHPGVSHAAPGPLTGAGDEDHGGRGDGGGGLDERLDTGVVARERLEVSDVVGILFRPRRTTLEVTDSG